MLCALFFIIITIVIWFISIFCFNFIAICSGCTRLDEISTYRTIAQLQHHLSELGIKCIIIKLYEHSNLLDVYFLKKCSSWVFFALCLLKTCRTLGANYSFVSDIRDFPGKKVIEWFFLCFLHSFLLGLLSSQICFSFKALETSLFSPSVHSLTYPLCIPNIA